MSENTIILTADDKTAAALVSTIRAAVRGVSKYADYVAAHGVTRENVKDHALALAVLTYPKDEQVQSVRENGKKTRTRFGNAVQAAANGLRAALGKDEDDDNDKPRVLRVSLSGEGGGSAVVAEDHPLYATLVALVGVNGEQQS